MIDGKRTTRRGQAVLAEDSLRFHTGRTGRHGADFALKLDYDELTSISVDPHAGTLTLRSPGQGEVVLELGRIAPDWKALIEKRPNRLDDLGVTPTSRVALVAVDDDQLARELTARVQGFSLDAVDPGGSELDVIFLGVEHKADLAAVSGLASRLCKRGVLWLVHPVMSRKVPSGSELVAAGRAAGLSAGGVLPLSDTHQALPLTRI